MSMSRVEFEDLWDDIISAMRQRSTISTLSQGVEDDILEVSSQAIAVRSHRTENRREIPKEDFRRAWEIIQEYGQFAPSLHKGLGGLVGRSSIVTAIMATSKYIEHDMRPIAVRLRPEHR